MAELTGQPEPSSRTDAASPVTAAPHRVLVVNAGSSSLKLRVLGGPGAGGDEVTGAADGGQVGRAGYLIATRAGVAEHAELETARSRVDHENPVRRGGDGGSRVRSG